MTFRVCQSGRNKETCQRQDRPICLPGKWVFCRPVSAQNPLSLSQESGQWSRTHPTEDADLELRRSPGVDPTSIGSGPQFGTLQANAVLSKRTYSRSPCHPTDLQFQCLSHLILQDALQQCPPLPPTRDMEGDKLFKQFWSKEKATQSKIS